MSTPGASEQEPINLLLGAIAEQKAPEIVDQILYPIQTINHAVVVALMEADMCKMMTRPNWSKMLVAVAHDHAVFEKVWGKIAELDPAYTVAAPDSSVIALAMLGSGEESKNSFIDKIGRFKELNIEVVRSLAPHNLLHQVFENWASFDGLDVDSVVAAAIEQGKTSAVGNSLNIIQVIKPDFKFSPALVEAFISARNIDVLKNNLDLLPGLSQASFERILRLDPNCPNSGLFAKVEVSDGIALATLLIEKGQAGDLFTTAGLALGNFNLVVLQRLLDRGRYDLVTRNRERFPGLDVLDLVKQRWKIWHPVD